MSIRAFLRPLFCFRPSTPKMASPAIMEAVSEDKPTSSTTPLDPKPSSELPFDEEDYEVTEDWRIQDNWTPLHEAAESLSIPKLKALLHSNRYPVNSTTKETNETALHKTVTAWCDESDTSKKVEAINLLVAAGADLNPHDCVGATPLHGAAKGNHLAAAKTLLDLGADVNVDNREPERNPSAHEGGCSCGNSHGIQGILAALTGGRYKREEFRVDATPLHDAAGYGHLEMVKLLLERGARVDAFDRDDGTPLTRAVVGENLDVCKLLLDLEGGLACLSVKQRQGNLPIHYAGAGKDPEILELLIEKGAEVDVQVDEPSSWAHGRTALSAACGEKSGMEENVRTLLAAGADSNKQIKDGATPFLLSLVSGNVPVVKLLLENGADVKNPLVQEAPPLIAAATKGFAEICQLLIKAGCDVNETTTDGDEYSSLHNAAGYGANAETVKVLVKAGADLEARNYDGRRPLHMAAFKGQLECVRELLRHGAERESEDDDGWTALHFGAKYGHLKVVKLLLKEGAKLGKRTTGGPGGIGGDCTAADLAKMGGFKEIVEVLVGAGDDLSLEEEEDEDLEDEE